MVVYIVISATWVAVGRSNSVHGQSEIETQDPTWKKNETKKGFVCAWDTSGRCVPSKCKALSTAN
jgi:hypothetical protein